VGERKGDGGVGYRCDNNSCNGSGDGGSIVAVMGGESEVGGESDWSESRQELIGSEGQQNEKGNDSVLRLEYNQDHGNSVGAPITQLVHFTMLKKLN
jgi:hypothetical protein